MLTPDPALIDTNAALDVRLANVNVRIEAPESVLAVLGSTLEVVPRFENANDTPDLVVSVRRKDDVWEIHGLEGSLKVLDAASAMPQIAGAVVTSAMTAAASHRTLKTMRATVIERNGYALAMVGDDWESAITLAAHLHGRGWSYIGSDNAMLDPETLDVFPIQKSLYVNSSSVAQFPISYRRAVEASPWYVTAQGISFYAVDPRDAGHRQTWSHAAKLTGVIVIDGTMADRPAIESVDAPRLQGERLGRWGIDWAHVSAGDLVIGNFVDTCDLLEHWFGSIAP